MSLPRNQKFVTRVNYKDSLARVFQMVCHEKNLDPYKYELRHPTHPDEPLNMATPLEHYGIHEICVVSVSGKPPYDYVFACMAYLHSQIQISIPIPISDAHSCT